MLLIIGFALLIITIFLIHYTPDENKILTRLYLVFFGLTATFIMLGLVQTSNTAYLNDRRRETMERRTFYVMALEEKENWKTADKFLELGEKISCFNSNVIRANRYSNSIFAPLIKGLLYYPNYEGLEPIPIRETGT